MSKKGGFACICGFIMLKMFDSAERADVAQLCILPWITFIDLLQGLNWTLFLQQGSYTTNTIISAIHDASTTRDSSYV